MSSEGSDRKQGAASAGKARSDRKDKGTGRVVKAGTVKAGGRSSSRGHSSGHDRAASSGR